MENGKQYDNLIEILKPYSGQVEFAFFMTYSLNLLCFEEILKVLDLNQSIGIDKQGAIDSKAFFVCYQNGKLKDSNSKLATVIAKNSISLRGKQGGCFHTKLILLKLSAESGKSKYKLIVSSKNITKSTDLEYYCILDGEKKDVEQENTGKRLWGYIKKYIGQKDKLIKIMGELDELKVIEFKYNAKNCIGTEIICDPDINTNMEIKGMANGRKPLMVVSPFAAYKVMKPDTDKGKVKILTFSPVQALESEDKEQVELRIDNNYYRHAKLYCGVNGENTILYCGSANCSYSAFGNNSEMLVKLTFIGEDVYEEFNNLFNGNDTRECKESDVAVAEPSIGVINISSGPKKIWVERLLNNRVKYHYCFDSDDAKNRFFQKKVLYPEEGQSVEPTILFTISDSSDRDDNNEDIQSESYFIDSVKYWSDDECSDEEKTLEYKKEVLKYKEFIELCNEQYKEYIFKANANIHKQKNSIKPVGGGSHIRKGNGTKQVLEFDIGYRDRIRSLAIELDGDKDKIKERLQEIKLGICCDDKYSRYVDNLIKTCNKQEIIGCND